MADGGNTGKGHKAKQHHQHVSKYVAQFARTRKNKQRRILKCNGPAALKKWMQVA